MSIQYVTKWFGKTGRGLPQTEQVDENGVKVMEDGKPVLGNEQFSCNQLTPDSINAESVDSLVSDLLEVAGSDLATVRQIVLIGANRYFREQASGTDEATKTARILQKAGFGKGLSLADLAQAIRDGKVTVG